MYVEYELGFSKLINKTKLVGGTHTHVDLAGNMPNQIDSFQCRE